MKTFTTELANILGPNLENLSSPSLRLEKFLDLSKNGKREQIEGFIKASGRCQRFNRQSINIVESIALRMKLNGRLIINQAGGLLENANLCVHRHFGCPYIPGSAVKGVARHAAWCDWKDLSCEDESKAESLALSMAFTFGYPTMDENLDNLLSARHPALFGSNERFSAYAGAVSFLAAFPDGEARLATDIVNCHHMKYYNGKEGFEDAPDTESPNPQFFPVVEAGAKFVFTIAPVRRALPNFNRLGLSGFSPMAFAKECLVKGLSQNGIGAKTAAGYGWFEPVN